MKPAGFPRTLAEEPHITNDLQKSLDFNHSKTMKLIIYKRSILNKVSINRNTPETRLCVDQFREIGSEAHKNLIGSNGSVFTNSVHVWHLYRTKSWGEKKTQLLCVMDSQVPG